MFGTWPSMATDDGAASTQPLMKREVGDELQVGWALPGKAQVHSRLISVSFLFIYFYFSLVIYFLISVFSYLCNRL